MDRRKMARAARSLYPRLSALLALILLPGLAAGQDSLLQGGNYTAGHIPMYSAPTFAQPIVIDSGPASGGSPGVGLSELNITSRSSTGATTGGPFSTGGTGPLSTRFCMQDNASTTADYHYLCFDPNAQGGGLIAYGAAGTASALPLNLSVNGTVYNFPFVLSGVVGPATSAVADLVCWNNITGTLTSDCVLSGQTAKAASINYTGTVQQNGSTMLSDQPTFHSLFIGANVPSLTTVGAPVGCPAGGNYNIGIGRNALSSLTNGCVNVAIGYNALAAATSEILSTAIGYQSCQHCDSQGENTALGYGTLSTNTTGYYNTAVGSVALQDNTSGTYNIAVGSHSMLADTTGNLNTAVGYNSLSANTTGLNNTAVGGQVMQSNTTGSYNVAMGYQALATSTSGASNIAIGVQAANVTTGSFVTAIGYQALIANTTGGDVAIGRQALQSNTTGASNVALGNLAGSSNTSGSFNVFVGTIAGQGSAGMATNGVTAVGYGAGENLNSASHYNTLIGYSSGVGITSGTGNVFLGPCITSACYNQITTGQQNVAIGYDVGLPSQTSNGQLVVANFLYGTGMTGTSSSTSSSGKLGILTKTPNSALDLNGAFTLEPMTAPGSPPAGNWIMYVDSGDSNKLKIKASTGTVVTLGTP